MEEMTANGAAAPSRRGRRWLVWLALGATAVAASGAVLGVQWLGGRRDREEGLRLAEHGRFARALPFLHKALARYPADVPVVRALALGTLAARDTVAAEEYIARWVELRPDDPEPLVSRMELNRYRLRRDQAIDDGRRILALAPDRDDVRAGLAELYLEYGRCGEAERECRTLLTRHPADPQALYLLANAYHRMGRFPEAAAVLDPIVRDHPEMTGAVLLRGILYYEAGQPKRAAPLLRQALTGALGEAGRKKACYYLGLSLARLGQTAEARRLIAESQVSEGGER